MNDWYLVLEEFSSFWDNRFPWSLPCLNSRVGNKVRCNMSVVCTNTPQSYQGRAVCVCVWWIEYFHWIENWELTLPFTGHVLSGVLVTSVLCQVSPVSPLWCSDDGPLWSDPGPLSHRLHLFLSTDSDGEWKYGQSWKHHTFYPSNELSIPGGLIILLWYRNIIL